MQTIEINIDELIEEAIKHMEDIDDVRWSVGMALQVLYENKWLEVQERLNKRYLDRIKENTLS
jgi:hypothetical protein